MSRGSGNISPLTLLALRDASVPSSYLGAKNRSYGVFAAPQYGFCKLLQVPSKDLYFCFGSHVMLVGAYGQDEESLVAII